MHETLSRPGARLVVVEENGWRKQKLVFADSARADTREEDEGWRQFFLGLASRTGSRSHEKAYAYRSLALLAAKVGEWDEALEYYELMEKEDYEHAFITEVDIAKEKEALTQRRYPIP